MPVELTEQALAVSEKVESEAALAEPVSPDVEGQALDSVLSHAPTATVAVEERTLGGSSGRYYDARLVEQVSAIAARSDAQSQRISELLALAEGLRGDDVEGFRKLAFSVRVVWRGDDEFLLTFHEALYVWLLVDDRMAVLGTAASRVAAIVMAFLEGMLDVVADSGLLDPAIRDHVVEMHEEAILYLNVFYGTILDAGAVCGYVQRGIDDFVGLGQLVLALTWNIDQTVDFVGEMLSQVTLESVPSLAHELGKACAEGLLDPIVALLVEDRVIHYAFGVGKLIGPLVIDVVLAFTGLGELAQTALVGKVFGLLEKTVDALDPDFLRIVRRLGGKADGNLARRLEKAVAKLDKDSPEYQGYQALLEDGDDSMLDVLLSRGTCAAE